MSELTYNLSQIYNCKLAIKAAIGTSSDELADYAGYITALKPDGYTYLTENGGHNIASYEYAYVNVPIPEGYTYVSGTYNITDNGTFDVSGYESAYVDVEKGGGGETIYLDSIGFSEFENLDGMNNKIYHTDWNAYAITTQVFTQEYPTAGYLYLIPDSLGISKDNDVNAYLFEPTNLEQRDFSYANVVYTIDDADSYVGTANELTTNDLMKARVTFRYNPNAIKVAGTINGVTKPGPWGADGINTIMNYSSLGGIDWSIIETLSNKQEIYTAILSSDTNLNNFGSYVLIPCVDYNTGRSQDKFTASNAYATIYQTNYPQADEIYIMDMLNHKTYDCVLQRTSYKGGFTANKYETVLVDTYNYVGELQQAEIKGVRYGTGIGSEFSWDDRSNTYNYYMSIPANSSIQARTTYFELTTDGSTWNKFNFCEDMIGVSAQDYVTFKLKENTSGGVITTYTLIPSTISNYANIPTKLPNNYFRNSNNDSLDITISIDKDTWKVNYEFRPKDGIYMKLYDSRGQYQYIECFTTSNGSDGEENWTEYNFNYDKTKGSGYTFVFVKFDNNAIISYGSGPTNNISIWYYNSGNPLAVDWDNEEPIADYRFNYPSQSDVDDQGAIIVTYGDKEIAWMNIGSES